MGRFERDAQILASVNDPNIAAIHGLEESGSVQALVMKLVDGPTLAERLFSGAACPWTSFPRRRESTIDGKAPLRNWPY